MSHSFFSGVTADGNSTATNINPGLHTLVAWGTWGSGTIKLQLSPDDGVTWVDVPSASFTANSCLNVNVAADLKYRANLAGSTGANLNLKVF